MSDIYCRKCGEPWDLDSLHDNPDGLPFGESLVLFRKEGCQALGSSHSDNRPTGDTAAILEAGYDLLGDDPDGLASFFEDHLR